MKTIIIQIALKLGTQLLIMLMRNIAEELEKRKDNDFEQAKDIVSILSGVHINGNKR